jgi:protein TonB
MRTEICVALLASTALHAGLIALVPAGGAARDSARVAAAPRVLITARLKNTLAPRQTSRLHAAHSAGRGRPTRAAAVTRQARIDNAQRFYPPEAVARGLEGEAILMLRFDADGALIDAQIARSSGHAILDDAALRAVRAAPRLAAGPREVLFPVTFELH